MLIIFLYPQVDVSHTKREINQVVITYAANSVKVLVSSVTGELTHVLAAKIHGENDMFSLESIDQFRALKGMARFLRTLSMSQPLTTGFPRIAFSFSGYSVNNMTKVCKIPFLVKCHLSGNGTKTVNVLA